MAVSGKSGRTPACFEFIPLPAASPLGLTRRRCSTSGPSTRARSARERSLLAGAHTHAHTHVGLAWLPAPARPSRAGACEPASLRAGLGQKRSRVRRLTACKHHRDSASVAQASPPRPAGIVALWSAAGLQTLALPLQAPLPALQQPTALRPGLSPGFRARAETSSRQLADRWQQPGQHTQRARAALLVAVVVDEPPSAQDCIARARPLREPSSLRLRRPCDPRNSGGRRQKIPKELSKAAHNNVPTLAAGRSQVSCWV